jgi:hypothetical protein
MFRAARRSSSGALNCICSLWFIYPRGDKASALATAGHHMDIYTRGCKYSLELLMMSGVPLETCWAFKNLWNNKFYYKAASCWYFYRVIYVARIHEYQISFVSVQFYCLIYCIVKYKNKLCKNPKMLSF